MVFLPLLILGYDQVRDIYPESNCVMEKYKFSIWHVLMVFVLMFFVWNFVESRNVSLVSYSEFKTAILSNEVSDLTIASDEIKGKIHTSFLAKNLPGFRATSDDASEWHDFYTVRVMDPDLIKFLDSNQIHYTGEVESGFIKMVIEWIVISVIMFVIWQLAFSRMGPGRGVMAIGKSKARIYVKKAVEVTFNDVAGIDEAVDELREVVAFLTRPSTYTKLGGRLPKGVLLVGPPGTGKTLLAKAVAGEAKVPFFSLSGSEFVEMFVGVGAARVRDLFQQAQENAPCIIFIDELDALGKTRGTSVVSSNEEREQTLNQLLTEMDGFNPNQGVVLMAATNRPEILDPALLRAGRFDKHVMVDKPDVKGREAILRIHLRHIIMAPDVEVSLLASRTPGFVGADLENIVNEAAILAAHKSKESVAMADFEEAIDRVLSGPQKKSSLMTAEEKHRVAYHEAGHAIAAVLLDQSESLHKVSIIPRGISALGYTMLLPGEDRHIYTRSELLSRLAVLLGGRAAEEINFKESSTGVADDLQKATELARRLVMEFGMSEALGPVGFPVERNAFLRSFQETPNNFSEATFQMADKEVIKIVQATYQTIHQLLESNQATLNELAALLEERETLDGNVVQAILKRHQLLPLPVPV
jgi:cell division protease FtsH